MRTLITLERGDHGADEGGCGIGAAGCRGRGWRGVLVLLVAPRSLALLERRPLCGMALLALRALGAGGPPFPRRAEGALLCQRCASVRHDSRSLT